MRLSYNLPTLIVDGSPNRLLREYADTKHGTVRIDGPLPTVTEGEPWPTQPDPRTLTRTRPLRVDDRVMLATVCPCEYEGCGYVEFATATVKGILGPVTGGVDEHGNKLGVHCLIEVTDVESLT